VSEKTTIERRAGGYIKSISGRPVGWKKAEYRSTHRTSLPARSRSTAAEMQQRFDKLEVLLRETDSKLAQLETSR
jgi:hypothetical protein